MIYMCYKRWTDLGEGFSVGGFNQNRLEGRHKI
jgi:hypothetical protein